MSAYLIALAAVAGATTAQPKIDPRIEAMLTRAAPRIDACVARHIYEQPGAKGTAEVEVVFERSGQPRTAHVRSKLPNARHLIACLRRLALSWKLPPLTQETGKLELVVAVYPGAKFSLKPPPKKTAEPDARPPLEDFAFRPGAFWNGGWRAGSSGSEIEGNGTAPPASTPREVPGEAPEEGAGTGAPAEGVDPNAPELPGEAPEDGPGTGSEG